MNDAILLFASTNFGSFFRHSCGKGITRYSRIGLILEADEVDPETGELLAVGQGRTVTGIDDWGEELPM